MDYQDRVIGEQLTLGDNIEKLKAFMHSGEYTNLSATEQGLLMVQLEAMKLYWSTLGRRIEIFGDR